MNNLNLTFAAMADPTRRAILARLAVGETTVMDLAEPFAMSQPAISRHIKVLQAAGLIERRVEGATRPCRLVPHSLDEIDRWLAMLRQTLTANYERLDGVLETLTATKTKHRPRSGRAMASKPKPHQPKKARP
jgi:DNA-binding transcriptional ArsR family regulator